MSNVEHDLKVGTKLRGLVNNEVFKIVDIFEANNVKYYRLWHFKTGRCFECSKKHMEHALFEITSE